MGKYSEFYARPVALDMVEENGTIWMVLLDRNGIVKVNKATREAEICRIFEGEVLGGEFLYRHVEKADNKLVLSPGMAERIAIYDIEQDIITYIPLKSPAERYKEKLEDIKFWNTFHFKSDVYLVGYSYPAIVKINMESMTVEYITDWVEEVERNMEPGEWGGFFGDGEALCGDVALLPVACMGAILELDLKSSRTKLIKINASMGGLGGIASADGENIWMVGRRARTNWLSCWNRKENKVEEFQIDGVKGDTFDPFYAPVCTDSKVFLMPISAPYVYEMDLSTRKLAKCKLFEDKFGDAGCFFAGYAWKTLTPKLAGEWLIFLAGTDLKWYEYNVVTGELRNYFLHICEKEGEREHYFDTVYYELKENNVFTEIKIPVNYYLDKILKAKDNAHNKNSNNSIGEKIFREIVIKI